MVFGRLDQDGNDIWVETHGGGSFQSGWSLALSGTHLYTAGYYMDSCRVSGFTAGAEGLADVFVAIRQDSLPSGVPGFPGLTTLELVPNPASEVVFLQGAWAHVIMQTIAGQTVLEVSGVHSRAILNVGGFPPGLYLIRAIAVEGSLSSGKLILH
jgi:hypothetical protein